MAQTGSETLTEKRGIAAIVTETECEALLASSVQVQVTCANPNSPLLLDVISIVFWPNSSICVWVESLMCFISYRTTC